MEVWIRLYTNKKGNARYVYEEIRFVDCCNFMNSSLDELPRILPMEIFIYLNNHFASRPQKDKLLSRQKITSQFRILTAMRDTQKMD